jgi:hypothetical protein
MCAAVSRKLIHPRLHQKYSAALKKVAAAYLSSRGISGPDREMSCFEEEHAIPEG